VSEVEVRARAAWSTVAEPGDAVAGVVVAALGAPTALTWAAWAVGVPGTEAAAGLRRLVRDEPPRHHERHHGCESANEHPCTAAPRRSGDDPRDRCAGGPVGAPTAAAEDLGAVTARVLARAVSRWAPRIAHVDPDAALEAAARVGARVLVPEDPDWPVGLSDLGPRAPLALWARTATPLGPLIRRSVALVGARAATAYGQHVAGDLAGGVTAGGATVVSGGAFGVDLAAHRGALVAGGPTVALLAGGVDRPSPEANRHVLERLVDEGGALLAESPPGTPPTRSRFLQRNRLIAAVTRATVVVEAAWRSGALSTASHAAELLRPVGAVPGPVTSMASAGCHRLLRDGAAVCVTGPEDVLELLGSDPAPPSACTAGAPGADGADLGGAGADGAHPGDTGDDGAHGSGSGCPAAGRASSAPDVGVPPAVRVTGMPAGTTGRPPVEGEPVATRPSARAPHRPGSVPGRVADALPRRRPLPADEIARRAGLGEREVLGALGLLELEGYARCVPGGWVRGPS
jgi:DNA processing protein